MTKQKEVLTNYDLKKFVSYLNTDARNLSLLTDKIYSGLYTKDDIRLIAMFKALRDNLKELTDDMLQINKLLVDDLVNFNSEENNE